ncbi:spore gernimation protein GerQ, partial [Parageobacillus thermoglucosidasius]|nr:spore gernimation protein GerQ [Parageobacillus thermoglucosidasius]
MRTYTHDDIQNAVIEMESEGLSGFLYQEPTGNKSKKHRSHHKSRTGYTSRSRSTNRSRQTQRTGRTSGASRSGRTD